MMLLLLLVAGVYSQCTDPAAMKTGPAGECVYELKIGSAVPNSYHGEWGIEGAIAQLNDFQTFRLGKNQLRFDVTFTNYVHTVGVKDSDETQHAAQVTKMINENDFVIGGGPWYAEQEMTLTNDAQMVNVLCCTGPDTVYQKAFDNYPHWNGAFGVHAPPEYYPQHVIRHAQAEGARKIAIIYGFDNVFTTQVATKNKLLAETLEMEVVVFKSYAFIGPTSVSDLEESAADDPLVYGEATCPTGTTCKHKDRLAALAQEVYDSGAEVVISCGMNYDAYFLAQQFKTLDPFNLQFKAVFFTVGATKSTWIDSTETGDSTYYPGVPGAGQYVTSGGQWDAALELCGDWFGPGWPETKQTNYCSSDWNKEIEDWAVREKLDNTYGSNYETASGAVAVYTLIRGIADAYEDIDIDTSSGQIVWDQGLVKDALVHLKVDTFFGGIGFNNIQRNTLKESVAIQWLPSDDGLSFVKKVIAPVSGAEATLVYPRSTCKDELATNPECRTVSSGDDEKKDNSGMIVIIVVLVIAVLLLVCVVMYLKNKGQAYIESDAGGKI